jgi:hypothetical protein
VPPYDPDLQRPYADFQRRCAGSRTGRLIADSIRSSSAAQCGLINLAQTSYRSVVAANVRSYFNSEKNRKSRRVVAPQATVANRLFLVANGGKADAVLCIAYIAFWSLMTQSGHGGLKIVALQNDR